MKRAVLRLLPVVFFFLFSACTLQREGVPLEQKYEDLFLKVGPEAYGGQSFVADYDGLQGFSMALEPQTASGGYITLSLFSDSEAEQPVLQAIAAIPMGGDTVAFQFEPQPDSAGKMYRIRFTHDAAAELKFALAPAAAYRSGAVTFNGNPLEAQLIFDLTYQTGFLLNGLLGEALIWLQWMLAGLFAFVLPGWAMMQWGWKGWAEQAFTTRASLAVAVGLAILPVILVWTDFAGWRAVGWLAWLPGIMAFLTLLYWHRAWFSRNRLTAALQRVSFEDRVYALVLTAVLALLIFTRFWVVRTAVAPLWGDSVQHAVITQRILENNGLFNSWLPYAPYDSLTVHPGFHIFSALLGQIMHADGAMAVLYGGQVLNVFAVLSLAALADKLSGGRRWAGLGAIVIGGLVTAMPAFYVNWGRYPQLMGQAILPAALWMLWVLMERAADISVKKLLPEVLLSGAMVTGMVYGYYRMPFYYAAFIVLLLLAWAVPAFRKNRSRWLDAGISTAAAGGVSLLCFLPWIMRLAQSSLVESVETGLSLNYSVAGTLEGFAPWNNLPLYFPYALVGISILVSIWAMIEKRWLLAVMPLWPGLLLLYLLGQVINLPGAIMLQHFAIMIWLYMPAAVLMGWGIGEFAARARLRNWLLGLSLLLMMIALFTADQRRKDLQPRQYELVSPADLIAMEWIETNLPQDALFLVEGFRIYGGTSIVGSDAGWWLPFYTGRANTIPPQYALLNEQPLAPDYNRRMVEGVAELETAALDSDAGLQAMCRQGITHLYIGQFRGAVGAGPEQLLLSWDQAQQQPALELVYARDRVQIYIFDRSVCGNADE